MGVSESKERRKKADATFMLPFVGLGKGKANETSVRDVSEAACAGAKVPKT